MAQRSLIPPIPPFVLRAWTRGFSLAAVLALSALLGMAASGSAQDSEEEDEIRIGLPAYVMGDPAGKERAMYKDSTISVNNQCPVRGGRIDPKRAPVYINNRAIGFCCMPCPSTFSYDPEKYLRAMKVSLNCPVRPARRAILDSSLRARINQDFFFFSSMAAMKQFQKDPLRYAGKLTDPVSQERFVPKKDSPRVTFRGRDYYFSSPSTLATFQATPERYFERQTGT